MVYLIYFFSWVSELILGLFLLTPPLTTPGGARRFANLLICATLFCYRSYFACSFFGGCLVTCHILHFHLGGSCHRLARTRPFPSPRPPQPQNTPSTTPPFPHPAATAAAPPPRPRPGPMQLRRRPWPAPRSPAACPTSGHLRVRAAPMERALARVFREAGARVSINVPLSQWTWPLLSLTDAKSKCWRRGAPTVPSWQLTPPWPARRRPPWRRHGPRGDALQRATARKRTTTYPEFAQNRRCQL